MIDPRIGPTIAHDAHLVAPSTPVSEAAQHLREPSVPILVVRDDDEVVGVVTESDLVALFAETDDPATVAQCMSSPVTIIRPDTTVREAARRMCDAGVRHLPVVDDQGVYHGIVSRTTLAPYCSRHTLDVQWTDEPLQVDATGTGSVPAIE